MRAIRRIPLLLASLVLAVGLVAAAQEPDALNEFRVTK
jgi:hypothetical protein